jgi:hypothetical protein
MWNAQKVGMEQERNGERSITWVDNRESCSINKPALKCDVVNVKYVWQCDQFVPYVYLRALGILISNVLLCSWFFPKGRYHSSVGK